MDTAQRTDSKDEAGNGLTIARFSAIAAIAVGVVMLALATIRTDLEAVIAMGLYIVLLSMYFTDVPVNDALRRRHPVPLLLAVVAFMVGLLVAEQGALYAAAALIFPVLTMSVLGNRRGQWVSMGLGILWVLMLFVSIGPNTLPAIAPATKMVYIVLYVAHHLLVLSIHHEIGRREARMRAAHEEMAMNSQMNSRALAKLSHDIRTPLNNILMVSNIMSNARTDVPHSAELMQTMQSSANSLVSVLNGMENLAIADIRPEADLQVRFNLVHTLSGIDQLVQQLHPDLSCTHTIDTNLPQHFVGDPIHIKQIALNVLDSISQHKVTSQASVSINVERARECPIGLHFEFNVSEPLRPSTPQAGRTDASNSPSALIGSLDLAISQLLVQKHGGTVHVELAPSSAQISFDYRLDSYDANRPHPTQPSPQPVVKPARPQSAGQPMELSKAQVLLVEDNQINQKIVMLSLDKMVKSVEVANNGREALDKFASNRYDIILMDVQMPIMDGFVTTKKIRELEASIQAHTPIIAITANALMGDREQCIEAGMDDYISKPFQVEVLVEKMERLLGAKQ